MKGITKFTINQEKVLDILEQHFSGLKMGKVSNIRLLHGTRTVLYGMGESEEPYFDGVEFEISQEIK